MDPTAPLPRSPVRLMIVASIRLYREGLTLLERQDVCQVVGAFATGLDAIASLVASSPDIILLDMATPDSRALGREFRALAPDLPIVAIGIHDDDEELLDSTEMGAAGHVTRDGLIDDLFAAVRCAVRGELLCSPRVAGLLARRLAALAPATKVEARGAQLTRREREIASLLRQNLSNKEIAVRLSIEVATVKNHVHNLLSKLDVHSRGDASEALGSIALQQKIRPAKALALQRYVTPA